MPYMGVPANQAGGTMNSPPAGWLWCDGGGIPQSMYPALYALCPGGLTPDLRGRMLVGVNDPAGLSGTRSSLATGTVGSVVGTDAMSVSQMPEHEHKMEHVHNHLLGTFGTGASTQNAVLGQQFYCGSSGNDCRNTSFTFHSGALPAPNGSADPMSMTIGKTGVTAPHTSANMTELKGGSEPYIPPAVIVNYIIKHD